MRRRLGRILPWVVTIALLVFVVRSTSLPDLLQATRSAAPWTVPALAGIILLVYLADSLAIWKTFGWFVARLGFREVLVVRGATYLLALLNYTLGQGAMVYFVNRTRGVPILRGTGTVLLIMGINLLVLLFMASAGVATGVPVPAVFKVVLPFAYVGLGLYVLVHLLRPRWLTQRPVLDVLLAAGLRDHLRALVVRVPHVMALVLLAFTSLRAFHVAVPLAYAVLCLPAVFFVAVLPISFLGLGTTQAVMLFFFARFAPGDRNLQHAAVIASSLLTQAVALAIQAVIGLICLRSHLARDLDQAPPAASAA
jgi:hypothetical protein